jgi:hypothetical protein
MSNYLLAFGSYQFPSTIRPSEESSGQDIAAQPLPRRSGSLTQVGRREPTTLQLQGELTAATRDDLDALEIALKTACYNGKQDLYFGRDDRFYKDAQLTRFSSSYQEGHTFGVIGFYAITFEAADYPEAFDANTLTVVI